MTKLFTRVYASLPEEVNEDNQLHQKVALIQQFIRPENLDIQPIYQNETSWLVSFRSLFKIILNCWYVVFGLYYSLFWFTMVHEHITKMCPVTSLSGIVA